jgi:hypothetical protein
MDSIQKSIKLVSEKMRRRRCMIPSCTNLASIGYLLCRECRDQWRGEIHNTVHIPDFRIGATDA